MARLERRLAAAGVAVVVLFVGAGTAAACDGRGDHAAKAALLAQDHGRHHGGLIGLASAYLGVSRDAVRAELRSGKTLAQVANATAGKSATGLVDYVVAAAKTKLDRLVAAGKLSQTQANDLLAKLRDKVTALVNGASVAFRFHHR